MVSLDYINQQLHNINYHRHFWINPEIDELVNILMPDETIYECVSGNYEGGSALLIVTNERVLLIDRKFLNFLTVEDMRFDRINQIDYSYRLMAAYTNINSGLKNLKFMSFNKTRLRKLVNYIQVFISESKKVQSVQIDKQREHLEDINQRLGMYLEKQDSTLNSLSDTLSNNQIFYNNKTEQDSQIRNLARQEILSHSLRPSRLQTLSKEKMINIAYAIGRMIFSQERS